MAGDPYNVGFCCPSAPVSPFPSFLSSSYAFELEALREELTELRKKIELLEAKDRMRDLPKLPCPLDPYPSIGPGITFSVETAWVPQINREFPAVVSWKALPRYQ